MEIATYTILKNAGDACGAPTDFRLSVQLEPGYAFENFQIENTEGLYVTKVRVNLNTINPNVPVTISLCNAPVVCAPESKMIEIDTVVNGDPTTASKKSKNYNQAQVGDGGQPGTSV